MNQTLTDTFKRPYTFSGLDADKNPTTALPAGATVVVASDDLTKATVVPDATPLAGFFASGFIVGGSTLGTVNITATTLAADGVTILDTETLALDIVAGAAVSESFVLGDQIPQ